MSNALFFQMSTNFKRTAEDKLESGFAKKGRLDPSAAADMKKRMAAAAADQTPQQKQQKVINKANLK